MTGVKDQRRNRVLVIEDAEAIRIAVDSGLVDAGHSVLLRRDGETLESDLAEFRPDVVILDVMLTARDGIDDRLRGLDHGRRRLRGEAVPPCRSGGARQRITASDGPTAHRVDGRRRGRRSRDGNSAAWPVAHHTDGNRVQAAVLFRRASRSGAEQDADPLGGMGFRCVRPQPGRGHVDPGWALSHCADVLRSRLSPCSSSSWSR
jgi:hypothetical protein